VERAEDRPTTAYKLDRLFNDIRPEGRDGRRYTNEEVAAAVKRSNPEIRVTGSYLSALRTGAKRNPSVELRVALARFFGVPAAYFLDDTTAAQTDAEVELAKVASNLGVRQLALRALELTPEGLASVTRIVEHVLEADRGSGGRERLDPSGGAPDGDHRGVAADGGPTPHPPTPTGSSPSPGVSGIRWRPSSSPAPSRPPAAPEPAAGPETLA
jgi:transcriptional regulator with XRE-family HTH domain